MSLNFLTRASSAAEELERFDLRDARDEQSDVYEPVQAAPVITELSKAGAVARYQSLKKGGTADQLIECGIELLELGPEMLKLAIEAFTRASRFEGAQAAGLFWLAEAKREAGATGEAIKHYRDSLSFSETMITLERLFELQMSEGLVDEAEKSRLMVEEIQIALSRLENPAS